MDIVSLLLIWLAFCMGAGLSLIIVFGITDYRRRQNCKWLRELQRAEDEAQAEAVSKQR